MKFVIEALYLGQRIEIYERIEFFFGWRLCNEHMHNSQFSFPNPLLPPPLSTIEIELLLPFVILFTSQAHTTQHHVVIKFD